MDQCPLEIAAIVAFIIPIILISIVLAVVEIVGLWFVFQKAGEPGWAAIIPVYNYLIGIKVAGKPWWYILLMLIPVVNIVFYIMIMNGLAKSFGKGPGFTVGLVLLRFIFVPILGFGDAKYIGDKSQFGA